jgi:hypothetical protein
VPKFALRGSRPLHVIYESPRLPLEWWERFKRGVESSGRTVDDVLLEAITSELQQQRLKAREELGLDGS